MERNVTNGIGVKLAIRSVAASKLSHGSWDRMVGTCCVCCKIEARKVVTRHRIPKRLSAAPDLGVFPFLDRRTIAERISEVNSRTSFS
jgi:hypothetical protein